MHDNLKSNVGVGTTTTKNDDKTEKTDSNRRLGVQVSFFLISSLFGESLFHSIYLFIKRQASSHRKLSATSSYHHYQHTTKV